MEVLRRSERNGAAPVVSMVEVLAGETCLAAQRSLFWRRGRIFRFRFQVSRGVLDTWVDESARFCHNRAQLRSCLSQGVVRFEKSWLNLLEICRWVLHKVRLPLSWRLDQHCTTSFKYDVGWVCVRLFVVMSYRVGEILVSWVGPPLVLSFSPPTRKGYSRDALKKDVGKILGVCCRGFATWAPTLPAKTVAQSLPEVEKVQAEAVAKKGAEALSKRPTKESLHPRKKVNVSNRHMSQHGEEGSKSHASKGKE
ncbi:hypothetical protein BHE74_00035570 [Ensete ventricosum]|nr:hypothetical protein BHE74_00035570 [Ensete ventricosum]